MNPETISRMGESRVIELDFDQKVEMEMVSKSCKDLFLYPILAMISNLKKIQVVKLGTLKKVMPRPHERKKDTILHVFSQFVKNCKD